MQKQRMLFGPGGHAAAPLPYEAQRDAAAELSRRDSQVVAILRRLMQGPASNADLAEISLKYTGRISDLRKILGERDIGIECYDRDRATGISWYRLTRGEWPIDDAVNNPILRQLSGLPDNGADR